MNAKIVFCVLCCLIIVGSAQDYKNGFIPKMSMDNGTDDGMERWGYVDVREGSHMFWWLYYTYHVDGYLNKPWIIWLQGGPGSSSCGYGNFELIGPLDVNLNNRTETWVKSCSVLFLDQPVGTGYSYVDDPQYFTTDNLQIAQDMIEWIKVFLANYPEFQSLPLYIFGESYGGKMGSEFAYELQKAIDDGDVTVDLRGIANGNAWLSPEDSVMEWAPHLYYMSNLDDTGYEAVNNAALKTQEAIHNGNWTEATNRWGLTEVAMFAQTNSINIYNILEYTGLPDRNRTVRPKDALSQDMDFDKEVESTIGAIHFAPFRSQDLDDIMNTVIRDKLVIIPDNVTWDGQSDGVFRFLKEDFMKPVIHILDQLLEETGLDVILYQGALDLICLTKGALNILHKMQWQDIGSFQNTTKLAVNDPDIITHGQTELFVKSYNNFKLYWVINAGHMVPKDYPTAARRMLERIIFNVD